MLSGCNELDGRLLAHQGARAYRAQRYDEAIGRYDEALARLPREIALLRNLALAHLAAARAAAEPALMTGHTERAVLLLRRALEAVPAEEAREITELLVNTWVESGRLGEAAAYFRERAAAGKPDAWHMLSQIEAQRGNFAAAVHAYEERLRLTPNDAAVHAGLATLTWEWLHAGGPDDAAEATLIASRGLEAALEASRLDAAHPSALVYAGLLLRERAKRAADRSAERRDLARAEELLEQVRHSDAGAPP